MLGFSQVFKLIKRQDLLEKGKNGRNAFRTDENIHFSVKSISGLGALCYTLFKSPRIKILCACLKDMEIPGKKCFISKGFGLGTTLSRTGLLEINSKR